MVKAIKVMLIPNNVQKTKMFELLIRIVSIATYRSMMRMKFSIGIPIS